MANNHTAEEIASAYETLDLALKHPGALDMSTWAWDEKRESRREPIRVGLAELTADSNCGTTACFAGWHAARAGSYVGVSGRTVAGENQYGEHCAEFTTRDLGLTSEAAYDLFYTTRTEDLPNAIYDEFGPRPLTAAEQTAAGQLTIGDPQ